MSTRQQASALVDEPTGEAVSAYLSRHPEFFSQHPELLDSLRVPHPTGGAAVSLIERQLDQLRARNGRLEKQLRELVTIARENETLVQRVHGLAVAMLAGNSLRERLQVLESQLRESFRVDQAVMVLFGTPDTESELALGRFLRVLAPDDPELRPFATLLEGGNPRCGQIRDSQRDFLFGTDTNEVGSAAMIPLGGREPAGLLALGSSEREHFNPGKGTDVLRRIGETVSAAVRRG
ncbi:MAG: DUF484 family protein [Gammaproteobacteria bacterium]|nr:DUF484 family protein [Gammaproteobacteria bacterium]